MSNLLIVFALKTNNWIGSLDTTFDCANRFDFIVWLCVSQVAAFGMADESLLCCHADYNMISKSKSWSVKNNNKKSTRKNKPYWNGWKTVNDTWHFYRCFCIVSFAWNTHPTIGTLQSQWVCECENQHRTFSQMMKTQ